MKTKLLYFFALLVLISSCKTESKSDIEGENNALVYYGGDILTMEGDSPEYVEALVVKDGKITFAGKSDKAMGLAGPGHKMIDLEGKTLLPGFIDGHAHFGAFSSQAIGAQILPPPDAGARNIPKIIEILKAWNTPENRALTGWIFGLGFDDSVLEEKRFPTKFDLDRVSTEHPVMIVHISGHFAVVNSKGLELLNITSETKDPEGGIIRRTENNEPNGVLEELAAIPYFAKALTPVSEEAANKFFESGQEMALSYGYTTAQDGRLVDQTMYVKAAEANALKLDVVSYIDYMVVDDLMATKWNSKSYNNHYRIGGMKITLDGSPQGRTAWRTEPYLLRPEGTEEGYKGYPAFPNENDVIDLFKKGFKNNWQVLTHGNGDAAIDQFIKATRAAADEFGNDDRRTVLIHGQYIREDQLDSLKTLDVIASLFPLHTFYWGDWHTQIIGEELGNKISPVRTALNKGVKITIHTDAPVALPNLMRMVGITVERKSRSGKVIGAEEKLSPYEALQAITIWSAFQHFEEDIKGSLEDGKFADLVILDKNPLKVEESAIKNIQVLETIKEGRTVYKK
ncbi:amidohydrolase [Winogradskyella aurantia]|uniref:Amidohydrolase n=1 Tax=Winogradskyella aurantia TaxID=1915063 RepID=A0A265UY07_9FLAO|nr:amidohydrolase [Winogradskyella aurantia]OZV70102.1 amidohydrolase [Winogradskyella aurantia]